MEIRLVRENKKQFLSLLLLADEQENMIDRYLERGELFALYDGGIVRSVCVVTKEAQGAELKNLATRPEDQRKGYGSALVRFLFRHCQPQGALFVGTGDSPLTVPFYEGLGFARSHVVENFFTEHYDHPMWEGGKQLRDMIYLKKEL